MFLRLFLQTQKMGEHFQTHFMKPTLPCYQKPDKDTAKKNITECPFPAAEEALRSAAQASWRSWGQHLIWNIKSRYKTISQCRQLSVLVVVMMLLVKHVSWYPTQQTNFHRNCTNCFLTTMQSQLWLVESYTPIFDFLILQGKRIMSYYNR